jgi:hypothetical protein
MFFLFLFTKQLWDVGAQRDNHITNVCLAGYADEQAGSVCGSW